MTMTEEHQPTTAALVPQVVAGGQTLVRPIAAESEVVEAFNAYQHLCETLLTPGDHQGIGGKQFRKKSAWRKLAVAMGVSAEIIDRSYEREGRRIIRAEIVVRATAPNGRSWEGLGACDLYEKCCVQPCSKARYDSHKCCPPDCSGAVHFSNPQHDLPATAATRATNRACADLFGFGEVCVPTRAEALTLDGWRTPDKLEVGDLILTYDVDDDVCRWEPVTVIHRFQDRQTFTLRHRTWSVTCTAVHKWAVQRKGWAGVPSPGRQLVATAVLAKGEPTIITARPVEEPKPCPISPRDAAIIGWLLTDGSLTWEMRGKYGPYPRARIMQSKYVEVVRELLGDDASEHQRQTANVIRGQKYEVRPHHVFELRAAFLRPLLDRAGMRTKADAVALMPKLDRACRQAMIEAMMLANGMARGRALSTGRRDVLDAFEALCALHGQSLGPERPYADTECWAVTLRQSAGVHAAKLMAKESAIEEVWCPGVRSGAWVMRLDGQVTITGNSAEEIVDRGPTEQPMDEHEQLGWRSKRDHDAARAELVALLRAQPPEIQHRFRAWRTAQEIDIQYPVSVEQMELATTLARALADGSAVLDEDGNPSPAEVAEDEAPTMEALAEAMEALSESQQAWLQAAVAAEEMDYVNLGTDPGARSAFAALVEGAARQPATAPQVPQERPEADGESLVARAEALAAQVREAKSAHKPKAPDDAQGRLA